MTGTGPGAFCTNCGGPIETSDRFCASCGTHRALHERSPADDAIAGASGRSLSKGLVLALSLLVVSAGAAAFLLGMLIDSRNPPLEASGQVEVSTTVSSETTNPPTSEQPPTSVSAPLNFSNAELAERFGDAVYRLEVSGCGVQGSGSGFAVTEHHLVTNRHVVDMDTEPSLMDRSGTRLQGRVIGWSEHPDVAVIEVRSSLTPILDWAPSTALSEGDTILSLGYPVPGTDFTATPGNIMSFKMEGGTRQAIRTDASLDQGNSGGPALTSDGRVAGIVTEIDPDSGGFSGGFQFIPLIYTSAAVESVVDDIMARPQNVAASCDGGFYEGGPSGGDETDYPNPYDPFWTVILASMETWRFDEAIEKMEALAAQGITSDILLSDDFPSLNPGYWVVYSGRFSTSDDAKAYCEAIKPTVGACYHRYVSWDSSYR